MSDINTQRAFVYDLYPGRGWHKKVDRMSDAQIVAIYLRQQERAANKSEENTDDDQSDIPF